MPASRSENWLSYVSLLLLALQSTGLTLFMKLSRSGGGASYYSSSVVCTVEGSKLAAAFLLEMILSQGGSPKRALTALLTEIVFCPSDFVKLALPAFLYAIQNNLCYLALNHLSALNFQVIYQMKILMTAGFASLILGKRLTRKHWTSLLILTIGVITVQFSGQGPSASDKQSSWFGFLLLLFNSASSGFAGVYFEAQSKTVKRKRSLWIQSMELGISGLVFSFLFALLGRDRMGMARDGFFYGYDSVTWITIALQSIGGILVAIVIRFADNIQKAFATSLSIVLCSIVSVVIFGHELPAGLAVGAAFVASSVLLYAQAEKDATVKPLRRLPRSNQSLANVHSKEH